MRIEPVHPLWYLRRPFFRGETGSSLGRVRRLHVYDSIYVTGARPGWGYDKFPVYKLISGSINRSRASATGFFSAPFANRATPLNCANPVSCTIFNFSTALVDVRLKNKPTSSTYFRSSPLSHPTLFRLLFFVQTDQARI